MRTRGMAASAMESYVWLAGGVKVSLAELAAEGKIPPGYTDSTGTPSGWSPCLSIRTGSAS